MKRDASPSDMDLEVIPPDSDLRHTLSITIECMGPEEYKNGGMDLCIRYSFAATPFGDILIASTSKGICNMAFADKRLENLDALRREFPKANFRQMCDAIQQNALLVFTQSQNEQSEVKLHIKGTAFQMKVWKALLTIPVGRVTTYGNIAAIIGNSHACRAVGSAVGRNPVAFLIPCHRVILATGDIGSYHWGEIRKAAIIRWEVARKAQC